MTFSEPDDMPVRLVDANNAADLVSEKQNPKEKPPSPEHIKGRELKMAEEILAMPEGDAKVLAFTEMIRRWSATDPEAALAFREKIDSEYGKNSEIRRAYYRGIADEMAKAQPGELLEVIGEGLWWNGQWRPERAALNLVAEEDFDRAVKHFLGAWEGKQHREESYRFARRIATEQSIGNAIDFAEALKGQQSQGHALRGTILEWAAQDVEAATQYIDGIEDATLRSYAIDGLVGEIWKTNPQESIEWALSMNDADLRRETFGKLSAALNSRGDQATLNSLLQNSRLSDADRAVVLERISDDEQ